MLWGYVFLTGLLLIILLILQALTYYYQSAQMHHADIQLCMKSLLQYSSIFKEKFEHFDLKEINICFDAQGEVENIISSDDSVRLFGKSDVCPCLICDGGVDETDIAIQCGICSGWFHNSCTDTPVSEDALDLFSDLPEYVVAHCPNCYKKAGSFIDGTLIDDVRIKLSTIQDKLSDMEMSLTSGKTENDSLQNRVESMKNHLSSNMEDLASVMSKVSSLRPTPGLRQTHNAGGTVSRINVSPSNVTYSSALNRSSSSSVSTGRVQLQPRPVSSPRPGSLKLPGVTNSKKCDKIKTVVIDNIKDFSLIKHSSVIKSRFNQYYQGMKIKNCFSTSRGNVFIELTTEEDARKVVAQWNEDYFSTVGGPKTRVTLLDNKSCQGIIRSVPLDYSNEDMTNKLQMDYPGVVAKRLVSRDKGPLYSIHLMFKDKGQLEKAVSADICLDGMIFEVGHFVKKKTVMRCFKCLRFDHPSKWCKENITCHYCAGNHLASECTSTDQLKCVNCSGPHKSMDKECEKFKSKMNIINELNQHGIR